MGSSGFFAAGTTGNGLAWLPRSSSGDEGNMMRVSKFAPAILAVALAVLAPAAGHAQNWPQRTVKFVVPLGPASGVDIGARLFADRLSARWGQPVVVENRPGGDGMVAIN